MQGLPEPAFDNLIQAINDGTRAVIILDVTWTG
jgi:hypothetical protein